MPARFTEDGRIALDPEVDPNDYFFPICRSQLNNLGGKVYTHIDVLGLPAEQGKAIKDLVRQSMQRWWDDVKDNSQTSYKGCVGPIELRRASNGTERQYVWMAQADLGNHSGPAVVQVGSELFDGRQDVPSPSWR